MRFSFSSIKDFLVTRLQSLSNFTQNVLFFGVYSRVLDIIAFGIEKLGFYSEFLYKESTFKTATLRQSITALAILLNYRPHRKQGASGRVKISFDETFSIPGPTSYTGQSVVFPKFTEFNDESGEVGVYSIEPTTYFQSNIVVNTNIDSNLQAVNFGQGTVAIPVLNHQIPVGQLVSIRGTKSYDGDFILTNLSTADLIVIESSFIEEIFTGREKVFTGHQYINVREGIPKEFLYTATGLANEEIEIFSDSVDNDIIEVFIVDNSKNILADVKITDKPFLINDTTEYHAEIIDSNDFKSIIVRFGDGLRTRKLENGERVLIKYATTKGTSGNILRTGVVNKIKTNILDSDGNPHILFVTNDEEISDGKDLEELESIRSNSRNQFQAGFRAASELDWETIIESHPAVHRAKVWTDFDLNRFIISPSQNVVFVAAVSTDGSPLTLSQQADISTNFLKSKRDITNVVEWEPLQVVNLKFVIDAVVKPVPFGEVEDDIFNRLSSRYAILNTVFGPSSSVYESNFTQSIDAIDSVIFHKTNVFHVEKSEIYFDIKAQAGTYKVVVSNNADDETDPEKQVFLLEGSVQLWLHRKVNGSLIDPIQVGKNNDVDPNILEGTNGYTILGGFVNYVKNTISYNIEDVLNDIVPFGDEGGSTFETTEIITIADDLGSLGGKHWLLSSAATDYYIWYNVDTLSVDPAIAGRTGIEINIAENSNSDTVAFATQQAIDLIAEFDASLSGSRIMVAHNTLGPVTDAEAGDSGFTVNITIDGKIGDSFGILNPEEADTAGYFVRIIYRTRNGNGEFINDVRLPQFFHITDVDREDIEFDLKYQD